jgi:hypothetical protein
MTMLTLSNAPLKAKATSERMKVRLTAKTKMQIPKPVTAEKSQVPARPRR